MTRSALVVCLAFASACGRDRGRQPVVSDTDSTRAQTALQQTVQAAPKLPLRATTLAAQPPSEGWQLGRVSWVVVDANGRNQIVVAPQDGQGERRSFAPGGAGFYDDLTWSPDGKWLSFRDNARALWRLELASGAATRIDQEPIYGVFPTLRHAWSRDSRWIAYTRMERSHFKRAYLHDVAQGNSQPLTDALSDVAEPVFDAGG